MDPKQQYEGCYMVLNIKDLGNKSIGIRNLEFVARKQFLFRENICYKHYNSENSKKNWPYNFYLVNLKMTKFLF